MDLVRDPAGKLNSEGGNYSRNLPADVTSVSDININDGSSNDIAADDDSNEDTLETFMVSDNENIKNNSSSDIAADANMTTTEQAAPPLVEEQDLPTTVEPAESKPANKKLVIGTWNIQSGRNARLETALRALGIVGVDLCFFTETKLIEGVYTQLSLGYRVLATNAMSHH